MKSNFAMIKIQQQCKQGKVYQWKALYLDYMKIKRDDMYKTFDHFTDCTD